MTLLTFGTKAGTDGTVLWTWYPKWEQFDYTHVGTVTVSMWIL